MQREEKSVALQNHSIYNAWKDIKNLYKYIKFKITTPTWNDKFELPDGSDFISHIQNLSML